MKGEIETPGAWNHFSLPAQSRLFAHDHTNLMTTERKVNAATGWRPSGDRPAERRRGAGAQAHGKPAGVRQDRRVISDAPPPPLAPGPASATPSSPRAKPPSARSPSACCGPPAIPIPARTADRVRPHRALDRTEAAREPHRPRQSHRGVSGKILRRRSRPSWPACGIISDGSAPNSPISTSCGITITAQSADRAASNSIRASAPPL